MWSRAQDGHKLTGIWEREGFSEAVSVNEVIRNKAPLSVFSEPVGQCPDPTSPALADNIFTHITLFSRSEDRYDPSVLGSHKAAPQSPILVGFYLEAGLGFRRTLPAMRERCRSAHQLQPRAGLTVNY